MFEVQAVPRFSWMLLPFDGCIGVEAKVLLRVEHLAVAMLRFALNATIHEHATEIDIDVICLEGQGFTSVDGEQAMIGAGETIRWPAGRQHRLWTEDHSMITLMIEHG